MRKLSAKDNPTCCTQLRRAFSKAMPELLPNAVVVGSTVYRQGVIT